MKTTLMLMALLAGCATGWSRTGATPKDLAQDRRACEMFAYNKCEWYRTSQVREMCEKRVAWECMLNKGWTR